MLQEVQSAKEGDTDRTGKDFEVEYGVMLWDPEVLPSHQAAVSSGALCSAAMLKDFAASAYIHQILPYTLDGIVLFTFKHKSLLFCT